ncbi:MAG: hypothetical protein KDD64_00210 [Bdellovibrionales bacterium]|nr:hypothetical protein [Bdellovibrionales bacterium]
MQNVRRFQSEAGGGMILLATAVFSFTVLFAFGIYYISTTGSTVEQMQAAMNHLALAYLKGYAAEQCEPADSTSVCHAKKQEAALDALEALSYQSSAVLGNVEFQTESSNEVGILQVTAQRHYTALPLDGSLPESCNRQVPPTLCGRTSDELANAVTIRGKIASDRLSWANSFTSSKRDYIEITSAAAVAPIFAVFMADLSASVAEITHLPPLGDDEGGNAKNDPEIDTKNPEAPKEVDLGAKNEGADEGSEEESAASGEEEESKFAGFDFGKALGTYEFETPVKSDILSPVDPLDEAEVEEEPSPTATPDPNSDQPPAAFFAYQVVQDAGAWKVTPDLVATNWENLPETDDGSPDFRSHAKDEYRTDPVFTYPISIEGRELYSDRQYHPVPGEAENITDSADPSPLYYYLDNERDNYPVVGPEPFMSIIRGIHETLALLKKRGVPNDRAALIAYDEELTWGRVINLTQNLDYPLSVLEEIVGENGVGSLPGLNSPDPNTYFNDLGDDVVQLPRWIKLRLFPTASGFTNSTLALTEAARQLSDAEANFSAVKLIVHATDGIHSCVNGESAEQLSGISGKGKFCELNYETWRKAADDYLDIAFISLFQSNIALHHIHAGQQGGAHTLFIPKDKKEEGGAVACISDDEARASGQLFVEGREVYNDEFGNGLFNNRYENFGFTPAAEALYRASVITGGIYQPVRTVHPGCPDDVPVIDCKALSGQRNFYDWGCRSPREQVSQAFKDVFINSQSFAIVDPDL